MMFLVSRVVVDLCGGRCISTSISILRMDETAWARYKHSLAKKAERDHIVSVQHGKQVPKRDWEREP